MNHRLDLLFLKQTGLVFIGVGFYNLCNLFYHFIMVRMLSPIDYGHLNTLLAIFMAISVPANTLQTASIRFVSFFLVHQHIQKIKALLRHLLIVMVIIASLLLFLLLLANTAISSFLKIDSWSLVTLLGISLFFGLIIPVPWGGLQGLQRFGSFSANLILNGVSKLLFGFIFIRIGWGVEGAMGAIGLAYLITTLLSLFMLTKGLSDNRCLMAQESSPVQTEPLPLTEFYAYFLPAGLTFFCFLVLTNIDLILVKRLFTPLEAGHYSIAQMAGKIVLFLPLPIVMVMFPKFASREAIGKTSLPLLKQSLGIAGLLCGGALFFCLLFPLKVIQILTGKNLPECIPLVQLFSVNMTLFSLIFILLYYHLAKKRKTFLYVLIAFTLIQTGLVLLFHKTLIQVLLMVSIVAFCLLIVNLSMIFSRTDTSGRMMKDSIENKGFLIRSG
jgi:O-antigen/teichoic acid export membrane protein